MTTSVLLLVRSPTEIFFRSEFRILLPGLFVVSYKRGASLEKVGRNSQKTLHNHRKDLSSIRSVSARNARMVFVACEDT